MKRLVLLGLCSVLSLVMVLGTVFSSSPDVLAVDMGGTMDGGGGSNDGNNMPPPQDAPATTDALTAGGGSDNDDDDDENDDNSGGSGEDDNADSEGDKDENNDKDNPQIPDDAPATTDALTAKKIECPPGQEVALFSTSCGSSGPDSTQDSTLAATVCPTSPTPTFYGLPDGLSVTNMIWESSKAEIGQQDMQKTLLHRVQGQTAQSKPANPSYYCPPIPYYEPPPGALPYKGNEAQLIKNYEDIRGAKVTSPEGTNLGLFTFQDGTIMQVTIESDANNPSELTRHSKITPGSNTPLDRLGVVQVDLPSTDPTFNIALPPNSKPGTGSEFVHKIQYNDGSSIIASKNENGDQGFWDVYDSNGQLKSTTMADPATKTTAIINKQDNSVTFHPQGANSYTVYPRAADGTQKTVTVTSEGQPVVTVRDANGNVIPPKE